jgi:hypothetical protein
MADLSNPQWRAYVMNRIDLAIDSGADGLMYDNNFGNDLVSLYEQISGYVSSRKKDFLLMANFHANTYVLNRLLNCITTEDGLEPGLYAKSSAGYEFASRQRYGLPVGEKLMINNFGLLAIHETLTEGWKPVMIEDGRRENEERMVGFTTDLLSRAGPRAQLSLAEKMSFGIALEEYVEGRPAHQLITNDPMATAMWRSVGKYNQFFTAHEDLYTHVHSVAPLAVILDDSSEGVPLLDSLAARGVQFNVIYERDLNRELLSPYKAATLLTAEFVRATALDALEAFSQKGVQVIAVGNAARFDEKGSGRTRPFFFRPERGSGMAAYIEKLPPVDELAEILKKACGNSGVRFQAPPGVLFHSTEQGKRLLIHLLNYTLEPIDHLDLEVDGQFQSARLLSPDGEASLEKVDLNQSRANLRIPRLAIYSVVALDRKVAIPQAGEKNHAH